MHFSKKKGMQNPRRPTGDGDRNGASGLSNTRSPDDAHPQKGGALGGVANMSNSPRRCSGLLNTSDTRLRCASPTKRGRKAQETNSTPTGQSKRPQTNHCAKKRPRTRNHAGVQVDNNLAPAGEGPAGLAIFICQSCRQMARPAFSKLETRKRAPAGSRRHPIIARRITRPSRRPRFAGRPSGRP